MTVEIRLTSEITVKLTQKMGGDEMIVAAAKASTSGEAALEYADPTKADDNAGLINFLMKHRHGSPFECSALTFFVHVPAFVWWEWVRHRIAFCLAGDTEVSLETIAPKGNRTLRKRPIAELYQNWHHGVQDAAYVRTGTGVSLHGKSGLWRAQGKRDGKAIRLGYFKDREEAIAVYQEWADRNPTLRTRLLPSCRNLPARVLNEETQLFEIGRMADIYQSGVKELFRVSTTEGHCLRCSGDHRILTKDGWARAADLGRGDRIAVCGKRPLHPDRQVPKRLREGIAIWTSGLRTRLIKETDRCYICNESHPRSFLALDHVVPVVADIAKALDVNNLKPICEACHQIKCNAEQKLARRCNVAGSKYVRLASTPERCGEEMTYDISMGGPWHNFVANNIVVHNSYSLESGRYKVLEPLFWIPRPDRKIKPAPDHKSARPKFVEDEPLSRFASDQLLQAYRHAYASYEAMVDAGVANEVARAALTFAVYYSGWITCNPRSLMAFLSLRTHEPDAKFVSYPQAEIEEAARACEAIFAEGWPLTYAAFNRNGRVGP